jgi:hypothetical protein
VLVDATGEVRDATLSGPDQARANADPPFESFTRRAKDALMDPRCATLPVPAEMLGKPSLELSFRFRP